MRIAWVATTISFLCTVQASINDDTAAEDVVEDSLEATIEESLEKAEKKYFEMDPAKLQQMWHSAMVRSLLKAKAKEVQSKLPAIERIVYAQCQKEAKSLMQLARCVVRLFNERDRMKSEQEQMDILIMEEKRRRSNPFLNSVPKSSPFYQLHPILDLFFPQSQPSTSPTPPPPPLLPSISIHRVYNTEKREERRRGYQKYRRLRYNPIRPQLRRSSSSRGWSTLMRSEQRRRVRRSPYMSIDEAYQRFLLEEHGEEPKPVRSADGQPRIVGVHISQSARPSTSSERTETQAANDGSPRPNPLDNIVTEVLGAGEIRPIPVAPIAPVAEEHPVRFTKVATDRAIVKNMTLRIIDVRRRNETRDDKILSIPSRNLIGLPRYMSIDEAIRQKRSVAEASISPRGPLGSSPNINWSTLAARYFGDFIQHRLLKRPMPTPNNPFSRLSNTDKLEMIRDHYQRVNECNKYFKYMNDENNSVIKKLRLPLDIDEPKVSATNEEQILEGVVETINGFAAQNLHDPSVASKKWSVLSPRFFSVLPSMKDTQNSMFSKGNLLSPDMFSLHRNGILSIPDIFNMVSEENTSQMMEVLIELSGAAEALDEAILKLEPEIRHTMDVQYPMVQKLSQLDHSWLKVKESYTPEQLEAIERRGYAYLEPEQLAHIYGGEGAPALSLDMAEYRQMSEEERERRLEEDIRRLADLGNSRKAQRYGRRKRAVEQRWYDKDNTVTVGKDAVLLDAQHDVATEAPGAHGTTAVHATSTTATTTTTTTVHSANSTTGHKSTKYVHTAIKAHDGKAHIQADVPETLQEKLAQQDEDLGPEGEEDTERINGVRFTTLEPVAFANIIGHGAALEVVTLSPLAFIGEVMTPEALVMTTLSPRAFIASILAPTALVARVLSPTAFRAEVLAPRALYTWVVSPEAFIAEVLSPHFLEPRILSPEAFIIDVLSPRMLSPNVMSPEAFGVLVLSPNILSPRIKSSEKYLIEVLSPHILGGPHSKEEEEETVISIPEHKKEHEGEAHGGADHPAHGPEAAWDLNGGGTLRGAPGHEFEQ